MSKKPKLSQAVKLTIVFFLCMLSASIITFGVLIICDKCGLIDRSANVVIVMVTLLILSMILGTVLAYLTSIKISKEREQIDKVIKEVSSGNFDVEVTSTHNGEPSLTAQGINKIISELKNVKILKADFISNFSHEFKTPIVSINGFSEILLKEDLPPEKQKEFLQIIFDESQRLAKLSSNMLLLTNLESAYEVPDKTYYSLDEQVLSSIRLLSQSIRQKNITLKTNVESVKTCANIDFLSQVWINVLNNAIKYSYENGVIEVTVKNQDKLAVVSIKDNGTGIAQDKIPHIFDKFYQGDKSHSVNGSGLGLSIAKHIVSLHHGKIDVISEVGKGSEFIITLPTDCKHTRQKKLAQSQEN